MVIQASDANAIIMAAAFDGISDVSFLSPCASKSLVSLNGRPAISYLVDSLKKSSLISKVIVVGGPDVHEASPGADAYVELAESEADGVIAGIREAGDASRCLILSGDMPLVSPQAIDDLLTYAPPADFVYPVVEKSDMNADFPDRMAYYVSTVEGKFTGSTSLLFRPEMALAREDSLRAMLSARKDPMALAGLLGSGMALKMMFSRVEIRELEHTLSESLDLECRVFISHYAELFVSLDSAQDVCMVEAALQQ